MSVPHVLLPADVVQELARRAAGRGLPHEDGQENVAAQYFLFLAALSQVLNDAPKSAIECDELEGRLAEGLAIVIESIHDLLPGGTREMLSYLSEERQAQGWGRYSLPTKGEG